jgi:hypothetical protein
MRGAVRGRQARADFDHAYRIGHFQTLERHGLAAEAAPGV